MLFEIVSKKLHFYLQNGFIMIKSSFFVIRINQQFGNIGHQKRSFRFDLAIFIHHSTIEADDSLEDI